MADEERHCSGVGNEAHSLSDLKSTAIETVAGEIVTAERDNLIKSALLDAQFENTLDGILAVDTANKIILSNRRFADMWDVQQAMIRAGDDKQLLQYVTEQLENPQMFLARVEYLYTHWEEKSRDELRLKDGRAFDRYSAPLVDATGGYLGRIWYFRDITESNQMKEKLRTSEETFRELAEHIRAVFFVSTPEPFAITYVSPAYDDIWGRAGQELYDRPSAWIDAVHPEDRGLVGSVLAKSQQGAVTKMEYRIVRPDGSICWIGNDAFPVLDPEGKVLRVVGVAEDITHRKVKEEALRNSEEQFRQLADNIHEVFFVATPDPIRMAYLSPAYEEIWGRPRQETYDRPEAWIESVHPQDREDVGGFFGKCMQGLQSGMTYRIVRPDGSVRWIEARSFPVRDAAGKLIRIVGIAEDTTTRTQTNRKLRVALEELKEQAQDSAKLAELVDILQSCQNAEEAFKITGSVLQSMLRSPTGALYMTSPSRDLVEMVASWGNIGDTGKAFRPDDCWALRRGKIHRVKDAESTLLCAHVAKSFSNGYVCVPMMAQGETLGMLHVQNSSASEHSMDGRDTDPVVVLERQVTAVAERISLALSNLRLREVLRSQSIRDPLTGLFNRRFMEESLDRELRRAVRGNQQLSLLMMDIDHFKVFNDTFGHQAGDALLRALGNLLKETTRGQDVVCRYGGEEFVFVLAGVSLEPAKKRAELLREQVKQLNVRSGGQLLGAVTMSIGIAVFPDHGDNAENLMKAADEALYRAKEQGRDRIVSAEGLIPA